VIGRVLPRGTNLAGLLYYLFGPGKASEHLSPHLVAGWRHPAELEPARRPGGRRDFRMLTGLMEAPLAVLGERAPARPVWHCVVRAAPGDPDLGDGAWMRIAAEVMHRTGLSRRGEEDRAVPWVAVHHGDNHVHIVAMLVRQDLRRAQLHNDYYRIGEALRDLEAEYGLVAAARADRTAARRPTRAETEKAARNGQAEPLRVTLRRHVATAAAGARSEPEFFTALARRGVQVRLRHSEHTPDEVTGYAVTMPGARTAAGQPVWFGGGKLAPDLTLPKLRARWPAPGPGPGRDRPEAARPGPVRPLDGTGMTDAAARATLRHQTAQCAAASRSETGFFTGLRSAGLLVRTRPGPDSARPAGYAVTLPGLTGHRDGAPAWYGGGTLDPALALGVLRRRWQAGQPGLPPAAARLDHADATAIYRHAAAVADDAARRLRGAPPGQAADIAWAAADILYAAADATGNPDLRTAADGFGRAARPPWGRVPAPTPSGNVLRTAAYLITATIPGATRRALTRQALIRALAGLAAELARLRHAQQRLRQADAARDAAVALAAASLTPALNPDGLAPPIPQAAARARPAARRRPTARPPAPGRSR
jgi:hypothetical protein